MATTENEIQGVLIYKSSAVGKSELSNDYTFITEITKCEGVGCAYKHSCNRYTTRDKGVNQFVSFYAMADEDCQYHQPIQSEAVNA